MPPNDQRATDRAQSTEMPAAVRLQRFFQKLEGAHFFGKVTVAFQNGKVCDVKVEQNRKLEEL